MSAASPSPMVFKALTLTLYVCVHYITTKGDHMIVTPPPIRRCGYITWHDWMSKQPMISILCSILHLMEMASGHDGIPSLMENIASKL